MSSVEARRPRRIIEAPAQHQPPAPPPRMVERFQRALLAERRAPVLRPMFAPAQALAAAQAGPRAAGPAPPASSAPASVQPIAQPVAAQAAVLALPLPPDAEPAAEEAQPRPTAPELSDSDAWAQQLIHAIVTLCERTDPAIEAWSVTLPMEPRILPHTELHLSLSRHRISLRFQTQSPEALRLLSMHRPSLASWLRQGLSRDRDIDIEIT